MYILHVSMQASPLEGALRFGILCSLSLQVVVNFYFYVYICLKENVKNRELRLNSIPFFRKKRATVIRQFIGQ